MKKTTIIFALVFALTGCVQQTAKDDPDAVILIGILEKVIQVQPNAQGNSSSISGNTSVGTASGIGAIVASSVLNRPYLVCRVKFNNGEKPLDVAYGCRKDIIVGNCVKVWVSPPNSRGYKKTYLSQEGDCSNTKTPQSSTSSDASQPVR